MGSLNLKTLNIADDYPGFQSCWFEQILLSKNARSSLAAAG